MQPAAPVRTLAGLVLQPVEPRLEGGDLPLGFGLGLGLLRADEPAEIARELGIQPATVALMLRRMEKSGLIERYRDAKDERVTQVQLTAAGKKAESDVRRAWEKAEADIHTALEGRSAKEADDLLRGLRDGLAEAKKEKKK